ncbi:MAG: tetratricopeptide repeat-containing sulfotransferase family protein [Phycisphaerales bacterium JB037]
MDVRAELQAAESMMRMGDPRGAESACRRVVEKDPSQGGAWFMLGSIQGQSGKLEEAERSLARAEELMPTRAEPRVARARCLMLLQRWVEARDAAKTLFNARKTDAGFLSMLVNAEVCVGDSTGDPDAYQRADEACGEALAAGAAREANLLRVVPLSAMGRESEAREILGGFAKIPPPPMAVVAATSWYQRVASDSRQVAGQQEVLRPLLARPGVGETPSPQQLARACVSFTQLLGHLRLDEWAERVLAHAKKLDPHNADVIVELASKKRKSGDPQTAREMLLPLAKEKEALERPSASPRDRAIKHATIEIGLCLDDSGAHIDGLEAVQRGRRAIRLDGDARRIDQSAAPTMIRRYRAAIEAGTIPVGGTPADRSPVFFVGFPRSGTTLTEQMLEAHPSIMTTGERPVLMAIVETVRRQGQFGGDPAAALSALTEEQIGTVRERYWQFAARAIGRDAEGITLVDKLPLNILHLPWVARLFPGAKVVVALRDPRDIMVSCVFQSFGLNEWTIHMGSLESAAELYAGVMGLYLEWKSRLGLDLFESRYESMVEDPEKGIRAILDHLGLPFDEAVLRYHERAKERFVMTPSAAGVTEAVYDRSAGRWAKYRPRIDAILPTLEPYLDAFGYD